MTSSAPDRTKLLLVIPTLDRSGAEKQFCLLATGLSREGVDVRVLVLSRGGPLQRDLEEAGIHVEILHKWGRIDPRPIWRIRRVIRDWQPDTVLSALFSANTTARLATVGMKSPPRRIISERCVDSWKASWQRKLDRLLIPYTDLLIANSESVREFYQQLGFPSDKIQVIANGVTPPAAPAMTYEQLCEQIGVPSDARLVAYVGRLAPQKRIRDLLWGAQLIRQANDKVHLLVIGDGPERNELELYAEDVEAASHVRFLGHREDAASLLHLAEAFWLASEYEGMSNSLMEAMAAGKPVVVSDIPPNRELVIHEQDGLIVNLGDSVGLMQYTLKLLENPDWAARLGSAAAEKMARRYSIEQMISRFVDAI
ncbi:MAG: glycosyltransferase [Planctomycetaceae bacterium]|nr:glycosyltransferase [Planctomycetaceae bacterium]